MVHFENNFLVLKIQANLFGQVNFEEVLYYKKYAFKTKSPIDTNLTSCIISIYVGYLKKYLENNESNVCVLIFF